MVIATVVIIVSRSNPVAFVAFVVEVVPPPLRGEGTRRAWIQACGMVAVVWWPFRSGGEVEGKGGGGAATLPSCRSVRKDRENEVVYRKILGKTVQSPSPRTAGYRLGFPAIRCGGGISLWYWRSRK